MNRFTILSLALAAALAGPAPAFAQSQPSDAEKQKIRLDCRSDFLQHCSGVQPGGIDALKCLESNMSSLSAGCQTDIQQIEVEMTGPGS